MRADRVDGVEYLHRTILEVLLVAVSQLADGNVDVKGGEVLLGSLYLGCELARRKDVVEERFRPELDEACDVWGLRVGVESGEEGVAASLPFVTAEENVQFRISKCCSNVESLPSKSKL